MHQLNSNIFFIETSGKKPEITVTAQTNVDFLKLDPSTVITVPEYRVACHGKLELGHGYQHWQLLLLYACPPLGSSSGHSLLLSP